MKVAHRKYRWYPLIMALFVTTLVISNIIAVKVIRVFGLVLPAAVILFPLAYIFGDVLTEVYGYARARQVIWTGFFCNLVAVVAIWIGGLLPAAPFWSAGAFKTPETAQSAYQAILGFIMTKGRFLWVRTISSTIVGEGADSAIFITAAFWGVFLPADIGMAILSQWFFKVVYETLATPLTYLIVNTLKKYEQEDYFDHDTNFNPFTSK